ncbi:pre-mRNA-splicing factor CWC26, related protein [Babesia caballi]|uniref:Pre-mRNA-splicing factor CWC26, related protein n=1 Tax=Babesia caballi TaxID=5871 RepID=A0AAV4LNS5_BABCB|nr:pre-mRNA-splicing factor CWC26, related protein [Babesia caballi]
MKRSKRSSNVTIIDTDDLSFVTRHRGARLNFGEVEELAPLEESDGDEGPVVVNADEFRPEPEPPREERQRSPTPPRRTVHNDDEEVVYRDKSGKRITREQWLLLHEKRSARPKRLEPAQELSWGKGLVQKEDSEARALEERKIAQQPLNRYDIDEEYDQQLKVKSRWNDPMLSLTSVPTESEAPKSRFSAVPNRFNIEPGYRWDGVIRGNGYEERWFKVCFLTRAYLIKRAQAQALRNARQQESYLNNIADMNLIAFGLRFAGASVRASPFSRVSVGVGARSAATHKQPLPWHPALRWHRLFSSSAKEVTPVVRLDAEGGDKFVYDNFGRLRVFIKFLLFQSVPLVLFAYCYRRFEQERQDLYAAPLESVDDVLRHLWSITRNAQCFLFVGGKTFMVNYSVGTKINFEGVDSLDSFLNRLQPKQRDALRSIYVSFPDGVGVDNAITSADHVDLLFYNQSLDSFASVRSTAQLITDPNLKKRVWTPKLGDEANHLGLLSTKSVRVGFGGHHKFADLEHKEDWILLQ